jgi:HEPN domain-containing protein
MDEIISKEKLKERELVRMFEPIEGEMELIQASAKFNYTINKTPQKETELILAYTDDTEKLVQVLKKRIKLLQEITS